MDAGYGLIIAILIVVGVTIAFTLRADFVTERAYGLLALALLAAVALGLLWPAIFSAIAADVPETDDLATFLIVGFFSFATLLAIALPGIVGLIEMAVARRWWWFGGLLAAMGLMAATIILPLFTNSPGVSSSSNSLILQDATWVVSQTIVLLVCAGYGVRATWFRSWPAA